MGWAQTEKDALVQTLRRADPEAETLCVGWSTRRLLAHLVQREQDLLGGVADGVSRAEPGEEKRLGRLAASAGSPEGYSTLVDRFVDGPPRWSPLRWASEQVNLLEYVIHHEDVRRGGLAPAAPRSLSPEQNRRVWRQLSAVSRLRYRRAPVGVTLARPDGVQRVVKKADPSVLLTGEPVELALYTSGRRSAAQVQVSGPPAAVQAFEAWVSQR